MFNLFRASFKTSSTIAVQMVLSSDSSDNAIFNDTSI